MHFPVFALKCGGDADWEKNPRVFQKEGDVFAKVGAGHSSSERVSTP